MKLLVLSILVCVSFAGFARPLTTQQKLDDLQELVAMIRGGYGPLEYKKTEFGIDIDALEKEYAERIQKTQNNSEFYYNILKFVAEFKDSHFGARIPTNHRGRLGFRADYIDGKVLIEKIDRSILSEKDFPFEKGDEIISFNGAPVKEELEKIIPYMGQGSELTTIRSAASLISIRPGTLIPVIEGKVNLEIRKGSSDFVESAELEWKLSGDPLDEFVPAPVTKSRAFFMGNRNPLMMPVDYGQIALNPSPIFESSFRCSGDTRVKIPADATIIMKKPFIAYYHLTEKGNIGYLRLPHYSPKENSADLNAYDLRFSQYEYAVNLLEKNTVGLIIDQDHNCGGSVDYLHRIVSLFAQKPFAPMQFELLATKQNYLGYKKWVSDVYKYTLDYEKYNKVVELVKETWLNSTHFLTTKTALSGAGPIEPNSITYTKPIIILIDELSGSGGDAFPAMMQGIGRATLLGTRTMGAGGHVQQLPPLAHSQITTSITKSLFFHPNNTAIENNGASPDIKYRPTQDDFMYEYRGYQKFYLNELFKKLK